jgi:hypothetical protein
MAYNSSNPFVAGQKARASHVTRLWNNVVALKEGRLEHDLGGSYHDAIEDTALVDIPGAIFVEIDGTNLGGLTVEAHVMTALSSGTGYVRVYNRTDAVYLGSEVSFTNTAAALVKLTGLTLAAGVKQYSLRGRGALAATMPRIWGAKLVLR